MSNQSSRNLSAVVLLTAMLFSFVLFFILRRSERAQLEGEFDRRSQDRALAIQKDLNSDMDVPEYLRLLYDKNGNHRPGSEVAFVREFKNFVTTILPHEADFQSIWWVPLVLSSERTAYEKNSQAFVAPGFRISEQDSRGQTVNARARREY